MLGKKEELSESAKRAKSWSFRFNPSELKEATEEQKMIEFSGNYLKEIEKEIKPLYEDIVKKHFKIKLEKETFIKFKSHLMAIFGNFLIEAHKNQQEGEGHYLDHINFDQAIETRLNFFDKKAYKIMHDFYFLGMRATEDMVDVLNKECFDGLIGNDKSEPHEELSEGLRQAYTELEKEVKRFNPKGLSKFIKFK